MRCGLIGQPLGHSFSKELHERLGQYSYDLIEIPPEQLEATLRSGEYDGLNVTIPYKEAVIPLLDELSPRARAIGAVNTVVRREGRLWGDNTDFGGLEALIRRMGLELQGKTVLIAGTGGTSKTAAAVAEALGAGEVLRLSRSPKLGVLTYEEAYETWPDAQILINTTPVGMYPRMDALPVDLDRLPQLEGVVDVVYNPLTTRLVLEARKRGIPAENGLYMLTAQAMLAAEDFTGDPPGQELTEQIYQELLFARRNLVLIGMPSCGKSTLGALLSKKLGREFIDSDQEVVKRTGMPITQIFRAQGEAAFRQLETEVIRDLSRTGGRIIATGGGAVLRAANVDALKQNGLLIFLDRPVEELLPTGDRPLADDREKLQQLYSVRYPIYTRTADLVLPVRGTPEETANTLLEMLK